MQNKLYDYKNWRENTPEGQAVIDSHNVAGEYNIPVPEHLSGIPYNTSGPRNFQKGGERLIHAQDGIPQGTAIAVDPTLTYGEYYAQAADASKKSYDEYITAIEKEKQRVANVRANVIPTAKKLDAADNNMRTDQWYNTPEGQAYLKYTSAENPKELEAARQALTPNVKALLPNQGKYNVARWQANKQQWDPEASPSRELYCTPYGCFTYQKAGANDVPTIGGNVTFADMASKGTLPFEKIPANQRQPGDMALWVETSPIDYTQPDLGFTRRPHHTTVYASPDADKPNNPEAGNYYNSYDGVRLNYGLTNYETNRDPADRMDYYRYIGQTKKMEEELKKKQAAWEAAENKADRGPRPTLATMPLDRSYFNTERPQEDLIKVDYDQQAIDRISQMDISDKKKRKLLKEVNDDIIMRQKFQQLRYPTSEPPLQPVVEPMASNQNGQILELTDDQIQGFKDGGFVVEDITESELTQAAEGMNVKLLPISSSSPGPTDPAELAAIMATQQQKAYLIKPGMMYYPNLGYAKPVQSKPVQSKPEVGKLPIKKLLETPEIIPSNYDYTPQESKTIRTASRSQTVMEPDPNQPGKFKVKELRQVPYSANFPEEGWLPMNAPQVMYYNPTTKEETEKRFQDGGYYTYSGRPGSKYTKDTSGKWMIQNESTNGKFIPLNDPTGSRAKTLNAGATYVAPQTTSAAPQSAPNTNIFASPQFMSSQQLQQKANNMAPTVEGTKWLEMATTQRQNEEAQAAYKKQQAEQARYNKASGAGSSATNAPIYANNQIAPTNAALPYVMSGVDAQGNAQLITQNQAQQAQTEAQKSSAFNKLLNDRRELEQVLGRKLTDKDLYSEEGQRNVEGILGNYYNQDILGKIEGQKQKNFEAANQRAYDNASWYNKGRSTLANLLADPVITIGNWSEFKGTPYQMSYGLRDEMNPEQQARFREASNADDYWLNDWVNIINPGAIGADARVNYDQGQYANMAGNVASLIPLAGAPKLLGAAGKLNTVKNIQKGIHAGMETPILRTALNKIYPVGNPLLQTGENFLTRNILNANAGDLLANYSRVAFPGAAYNYAQDPTAANFSEALLLGLGTPEAWRLANAGRAGINQAGTAVSNWAPYGKLYPKTVANIIKGDAPLSFSSFAKGDLVNSASGAKLAKQEADYAAWLAGEGPALSSTRGKFMTSAKNKDALAYAGDDLFTLTIPQTRGSAMSYNIQKQYANLESKLASGKPLTAQEQAIVQGADRSLLTTAEFDKARQAGAYADLNLSDDMLNHIRTATENPNNYWELPAFKADPQLELAVKKIIADPRFINKEEYLLDRLPRASEYKATTVPELQKELFSPINDMSESVAAIRAAAADRAAAERILAAQEQKIIQGKVLNSQEEEANSKKKKRKWAQGTGSYTFQDGGRSGAPITYIDQPNVYAGGNQRQFSPASAQALKSLNNEIAYEGELTDAKIAELKRNGFVVEDIDLHLPNNQQQRKPFELRPYGFVAGVNDGPVNNAIFGAGLHAQFDTPLKQLAAGITVGVTDVLGFDKNRVLYNDFRVNNPMFNLNYTIPNKKR